MSHREQIMLSLEQLAARGDPTEAVYQTLFHAHPDLESLFVMDTDGAVRGSMLQTCLECILDHIGPQATSKVIISASRNDHEGYGVPDDLFDQFFVAIQNTVREQCGTEWTSDMEAAWVWLIAEITTPETA